MLSQGSLRLANHLSAVSAERQGFERKDFLRYRRCRRLQRRALLFLPDLVGCLAVQHQRRQGRRAMECRDQMTRGHLYHTGQFVHPLDQAVFVDRGMRRRYLQEHQATRPSVVALKEWHLRREVSMQMPYAMWRDTKRIKLGNIRHCVQGNNSHNSQYCPFPSTPTAAQQFVSFATANSTFFPLSSGIDCGGHSDA